MQTELAVATETEFVDLVVQQIACGIEDAVAYWLGRVEKELATSGLTADEKLRAIALTLQEYKEATGNLPFRGAQA